MNDINQKQETASSSDEIRHRRRMDLFALRRKTHNDYIMSMDEGYPYRIIHRGLDVTPRIYNIPGINRSDKREVNHWIDELSNSIQKIVERDDKKIKSKKNYHEPKELFNIIQQSKPRERLDVWYSKKEMDEWLDRTNIERAPPLFYIGSNFPKVSIPSQEIFSTRMKETSMLDLFEVATNLVKQGGKEDEKQTRVINLQKEKQNQYSLYVTNPFKKEFTQTLKTYVLDNWCGIRAAERENSAADVYEYDRKKTFIELGIDDPFKPGRTRIESYFESQQGNRIKNRHVFKYNNTLMEKDESESLNWLESLDLFKGITLLQRILSSNLSMQLQLLYNKRLYSSEVVGDFKYLPQLLWIFSCPNVVGKAVTNISWNPLTPGMFAVSYGKYLFITETDGIICIWNIKNTEYPERMSLFDEPVTFVEFSQRSPRILSVAFWDGTVALMDGILKEPELLVRSKPDVGSFLPVYQFKWLQLQDEEALISSGENGEIRLFKQDLKFRHKLIMKIPDCGNTVNLGIDVAHRKPINDFCPLGPGVSIICQHPTKRHIYLAGSDIGCVHICSLFRRKKHIAVFSAHNSAVTSIQFNPADERILLTAGCDFFIRIWVYGNFETFLLQLKNRLAYVDSAVWNPMHPYMIVSVVRQFVEVWHIKENAFEPIAIEQNPYKNRNLVVSFSPAGCNFLIGDMQGYVYVYSFTSIPNPPKDPKKKLSEALLGALEYDKERLNIFQKLLGESYITNKEKD